MMTFFEFITRQQRADPLGTPEEILARAGIWPSVPHEVVIKRLVKRQEKRHELAKRAGSMSKSYT